MSHRLSYWKTTTFAFVGVVASTALALWIANSSLPMALFGVLIAAPILLGAASILVVAGGLVCLWRDSRENARKPDLFERSANHIPNVSFLTRLGLRFLQGHQLRAGDFVRVKSISEIEATLDTSRTLEGLPFMREMEPYCGQIFQVHRRVDKINDMRHKTGHRLRRVYNTVTLVEQRCSGAYHDGCQAECQLLWKSQWLKRIPASKDVAPCRDAFVRPSGATAALKSSDGLYFCQMTELWEASHVMKSFDYRQDLRAIFSGNLGVGAFVLSVFTHIFNRAQNLRGGIPYPYLPAEPASKTQTPVISLNLREGEVVFIKDKHEIAETLSHSRNRGLWFDREMIRFCGRRAIVHRRVDRVIHESTKKMVVMKTPCVILKNVIATGEFLRFCPQHEYAFWREAWLSRESMSAER